MDLATGCLGMTLKSPPVAGASPLNPTLDNIRRLEDFGAGAIVLPSTFEEQTAHEQEVLDALIVGHSPGCQTYRCYAKLATS
ncbi:MAG: hypothetical protein Q8L54_06075 [Devosia sp.]|nr:hypothetical protein [Devosia sp.]